MTTAVPATASGPLVRVERGRVTDEELAALTVVLLSRAGVPAGDTHATRAGHATRAAPRWDRPERHAPYRFPAGSWRSCP
ncbi:acyl-CoA carboxylase subunit epsilon [Streptomyces sediminimaris]|uniref:acyl-CoA carboxylase subunit epsilon n=1 Tax=Streptomyces sediminimaris TaxID=3383721 RepID=UPI00399AFA7F